MRHWGSALLLGTLATFAAACGPGARYWLWDRQLAVVGRHDSSAEDISRMLGAPPARCDSLGMQPIIGVTVSPDIIVEAMIPNGPAHQAGLRVGDELKTIDNQRITSPEQFSSVVQHAAREGRPLQFGTRRGTFLVTPKLARAEQCYWEVRDGQGVPASDNAYVSAVGGGPPAASGTTHSRFYRASCRVHDGFVRGCQTTRQE
jgi:membrane-associated protease RseP (regulator of RpoE activity)